MTDHVIGIWLYVILAAAIAWGLLGWLGMLLLRAWYWMERRGWLGWVPTPTLRSQDGKAVDLFRALGYTRSRARAAAAKAIAKPN